MSTARAGVDREQTGSDSARGPVPPSTLVGLAGADRGADPFGLSRAEAHALRRSAPLTHAKLQEHFEVLLASKHPRA